MRISIITISFNQVAFIRQAIESVLSQEIDDLEYIVIDAGSTDGSRAVIEEYKERITTVFEPDRGQADGLNKGINKASGEIVGFVNSDDLLLPGALSKVVEAFQRRPDIGVFFGSGYRVDRELEPIKLITPDRFSTAKYAYLAFNFIQTATFFRLDEVRKIGGFNLSNRTCWDGELIAMLGSRNVPMMRSYSKLAMFRIYQGSISGSQSNTKAYMQDRLRISEILLGKPMPEYWRMLQLIYRFINVIQTPRKLFF